MTKKDYELIASVIRGRIENTKMLDKLDWSQKDIDTGVAVLEQLTYYLANQLETKNPKFDYNRFLTACGVGCKHENYRDTLDGYTCLDCGLEA